MFMSKVMIIMWMVVIKSSSVPVFNDVPEPDFCLCPYSTPQIYTNT